MNQCVSVTRAAEPGSNVVRFVPRPADSAARLSIRDRMDIAAWQARAASLGYDRLAIHERGRFEPPDVENFLSIYQGGARWACWGLARRGPDIVAWCSTTGADIGTYPTMQDALQALLETA